MVCSTTRITPIHRTDVERDVEREIDEAIIA
jgi:hypothetical protein